MYRIIYYKSGGKGKQVQTKYEPTTPVVVDYGNKRVRIKSDGIEVVDYQAEQVRDRRHHDWQSGFDT